MNDHPGSAPSRTVAEALVIRKARRLRRRGRPSLRRLPARPSPERRSGRVEPPRPPLSARERDRRLRIAAQALVRTIQACPAPGVPPLRARDWLAFGGILAVPFLIVLALAAAAGR